MSGRQPADSARQEGYILGGWGLGGVGLVGRIGWWGGWMWLGTPTDISLACDTSFRISAE